MTPFSSLAIISAAALASGAGEGVVLHDGTEVAGRITALKDGAVVLDGRPEPFPIFELGAIVFLDAPPEAPKPASLDSGPLVAFRDGEILAGRVLQGDARSLRLQAEGIAFAAPVEALKGFRLREVFAADDLFETDLRSSVPPRKDVVYVRRASGLLRVEGTFRSLDEEFLTLEYEGKPRQLRRQIVLGVLYSPIASPTVEADLPAVIELTGGGQLPGYVVEITRPDPGAPGGAEGSARSLLVRLQGAAPGSAERVPIASVRRVAFVSDRVLFLSSVEPVLVEEAPLIGAGTVFPWRKDAAAAGAPLKLGGKLYRKGLGVHSRSILEYDLGGKYRSFAATVGLDDAAGPDAGVTFRVIVDSKEIFKKDMGRDSKPEPVLLPLEGAKRLRLVVDYGEDGLDLGDHAGWGDARVTR